MTQETARPQPPSTGTAPSVVVDLTTVIYPADHPSTLITSEELLTDHAYPKFDDMRFGHVALILLSLGLASFLYAIEQTIVSTSTASISQALNAQGSLTWIASSYLLTTTVFQPIIGRVADAVGTKRLLIVEVWIFILGNIIAGVSKNLTQLVAGRLISGVGGAGLLSLTTILVSQLTNERQRGSYLNLINLVFTVADATGPLVGGAFAKLGQWRWIFLFNAPFGPVITLILLRGLRLPSTPAQSLGFRSTLTKIDLAGMTMLISTLSFLVIALNLGGQAFPWKSPTIIGMFCASGVSLVAFVFAENRAELPVAPMNLFVQWRWRNVPLIIVIRSMLFFHLFATASAQFFLPYTFPTRTMAHQTFYLPIFLQVIGVSPISSAALVIPFLSVAALSSTITNHVAFKFGHVRPMFMSALAILPAGMGLMSTVNESSSIGRIIGYSLICGVGFGSGTQTSVVIAQVGLPQDVLSTVTALVSSAPNLGGVLGVGIIGTIINNTFRHTLSRTISSTTGLNLNDVVSLVHNPPRGVFRTAIVKAYLHGWEVGYWTLAGVAVVQFILALFLRPVELSDGIDKTPDEKLGEARGKGVSRAKD